MSNVYCHGNVHVSVSNSTATEITRKGRKKKASPSSEPQHLNSYKKKK